MSGNYNWHVECEIFFFMIFRSGDRSGQGYIVCLSFQLNPNYEKLWKKWAFFRVYPCLNQHITKWGPEEDGRSGVANSSLRLFLHHCIKSFSVWLFKVALCPLLGEDDMITWTRMFSVWSISVSGQLPTYPSPNSTTVNW